MKTSDSTRNQFGPALLLLFLAVVAPTVCVLWLLSRAVENERFAVREEVQAAYELAVNSAVLRINEYWVERMAGLAGTIDTASPAESFASLVLSGKADSVVVMDGDGQVLYPAAEHVRSLSLPPVRSILEEAQKAEFGKQDLETAERLYQAVGKDSEVVEAQFRALIAQARLYGEVDLSRAEECLQQALDLDVDVALKANALLLGVRMTVEGEGVHRDFSKRLSAILTDYSRRSISRSQRVFLMEEWTHDGSAPEPVGRLLRAEKVAEGLTALPVLAAMYIRVDDYPWWAYPWKTSLIIFDGPGVQRDLENLLDSNGDGGPKLVIRPPAAEAPTDLMAAQEIRGAMPRWQLGVAADGDEAFSDAAEGRVLIYFWAAALTILLAFALALLLARMIWTQMQVARLKNDLIATVSHELKTPLSSIRLLVDTLLEENDPPPQQTKEYLDIINRENRRLSRLIENFLTFSRMTRKSFHYDLRPISPEAVAADAVQSLHDRLYSDNCEFAFEVEDDSTLLYGDHEALVTVLMNLLDNALKYSKEEKRITLEGRLENDRYLFKVSDNGIGIPEQSLGKVFDRFYQVDRSLTGHVGGTGLGLAIVKFIVEGHQGHIEVRSEEGEGTTFLAYLPVVQEDDR